MFRLLVIFIGSIVLVSGAVKAETALEASKKLMKKVESKKIEQKKCPVLGGVIVPTLYYTYSKKIYVCCPECLGTIKKDPEKYLEKVQKRIAASKDKTQKTCPVMGGKIDSKSYYEYKKRIYVCCKDCIAKIKKNPDKYLKKMQKEIEETKKNEPKK